MAITRRRTARRMLMGLVVLLLSLSGVAIADAARTCYTVTCLSPYGYCDRIGQDSHESWTCAQGVDDCTIAFDGPFCQRWIPECTPDPNKPGCWPPTGCSDALCTEFLTFAPWWPHKRCWPSNYSSFSPEQASQYCKTCPIVSPTYYYPDYPPQCTMSTTQIFSTTTKAVLTRTSALLATTAASTGLMAIGKPPAVAGPLKTAAALQGIMAGLLAQLALDPPDPDFKVYAEVVVDPFAPAVQSTGVLSGLQATALNAWFANLAEINALQVAMQATLDKAGGAIEKNNNKWYNRQIVFYNTLQTQLADAYKAEPALRQAFAVLPIKAVPPEFVTGLTDPTLVALLAKTGKKLAVLAQ